MGHFIADDGKLYVDTDFINKVQHLPGMTLKHMGFGEFSLETPDGEVEFDRMRGKPFEGQSGRSHQMYDTDGGQKVAEKLVKLMDKSGKSEAGKEAKAEATSSSSLSGLLESIRTILSPRIRRDS